MAITKAILTGGGRATRLRPITTTINKHLIPLAGKSMIFYAIEKAVEAGIKEIFINTNPGETMLSKAVGDGSRWGIKIKYFEQQGGPQGIAHAVNCARELIGDEPFMFYLSDNVIFGSLVPLFQKFEQENLDCLLALAKVPDAKRFGVPAFDSAGKLVDVIEKPILPPSDYAVTGIYLYRPSYFEVFKSIKKSPRGEYEISDIHSHFLKNNYKVGYEEITGWWKDTGNAQDLIGINRLLLDRQLISEFKIETNCPPGVIKSERVAIGKNVTIGSNVYISGPSIIEDDVSLENCIILPYTTIGSGSKIKNATIGESIIFSGCRLEVPIKIKESIIGKDTIITPHHQGDFQRLILGDHTLVEL